MMNTALRQIITSVKPEIPSWLRGNLQAYYSGQHRDNVYYPLTNIVTGGESEVTLTSASSGYPTSTAGIATGVKIYVRASIKSQTGSDVRVRFNDTGTAASFPSFPINEYGTASYIGTVNADATSKIFGFYDLVNANTLMKDRIAINLGDSNSPLYNLTAPELDAILLADGTDYWDGTRNVLCNPNQRYFWADYSGRGNHAKLSNFAYATGSTLDGFGAMFDGVDDFVRLGGTNIDITNNLSVFCWVKGLAQSDKVFFAKFDATLNQRSWSCGSLANGKARLTINNSGTADTFKAYDTSNAVLNGQWYFIGFSFADGLFKIIVNGSEDVNVVKTVDSIVPTIFSSSCPVTIGSRLANGVASGLFAGTVGLSGIASKGLSASEWKYIYDVTKRRYL